MKLIKGCIVFVFLCGCGGKSKENDLIGAWVDGVSSSEMKKISNFSLDIDCELFSFSDENAGYKNYSIPYLEIDEIGQVWTRSTDYKEHKLMGFVHFDKNNEVTVVDSLEDKVLDGRTYLYAPSFGLDGAKLSLGAVLNYYTIHFEYNGYVLQAVTKYSTGEKEIEGYFRKTNLEELNVKSKNLNERCLNKN